MLRTLGVEDVGPVERLELALGERLNVLTGDDGLGKSFVLDVAFWALTANWAIQTALERRSPNTTLSGQNGPSTAGRRPLRDPDPAKAHQRRASLPVR